MDVQRLVIYLQSRPKFLLPQTWPPSGFPGWQLSQATESHLARVRRHADGEPLLQDQMMLAEERLPRIQPKRNSLSRSSLMESRSLAAFSNSNFLAASRISSSSRKM